MFENYMQFQLVCMNAGFLDQKYSSISTSPMEFLHYKNHDVHKAWNSSYLALFWKCFPTLLYI